MEIAVEGEVCTVVEKAPGTWHVLVKSAIWVLGLTTSVRPQERTVVRVRGTRPDDDLPKEVHDSVMAHPNVGIAPRMRGAYRYAELSEAEWTASDKKVEQLWEEQRRRASRRRG